MIFNKMVPFRFGRRQWILVTGLVLMIACLSASLHFAAYKHYKEHPKSFPDLLAWQLVWWTPWIPLVPLIIRLAQSFPVEKQKWVKSILIHAAFCVLFSLLHLTLFVTFSWIVGGQTWLNVAPKEEPGYFTNLWRLLANPFMVNYRLRLLI